MRLKRNQKRPYWNNVHTSHQLIRAMQDAHFLRVAGETSDGKIKKEDIDSAQKIIQKDRADEIVRRSSYHTRCVVGAVCRLAIVDMSAWNATSQIYKKYSDIVSGESPLRYKRVSDLLVELENTESWYLVHIRAEEMAMEESTNSK